MAEFEMQRLEPLWGLPALPEVLLVGNEGQPPLPGVLLVCD